MRRCACVSADAGRDGRGEQIRFFALHRARDDYGRQARDEDCQPKEQVERGRAVICFNMNHVFRSRRSTCEDASFRRAAALSWFSLSGLSWRPVRSSHFVAPRVGPFLGPRRQRACDSASDFELHF
jgi:hypothetical protein